MKSTDNSGQIKELLEIIRDKADKLEMFYGVTAGNMRMVKDQLSVVNRKLDSHSASLAEIEKEIKSYSDAYKENQRNIERLDTRMNVVEEELAIEPQEDLKVPHFSS